MTFRHNRRAAAVVLVLSALFGAGSAAHAQGEINIYSYREPGLINPLLEAFTAKTGIKANVVFATAGLNERLAAEGRNSPADVLLTVDVTRLTEAKAAGLTQPVNDPVVVAQVPAALRDAENHWFGLTMRSRVVYAHKDRVAQSAITYEELADPKWRGKICIRSGQHAYNTALVAAMIANKGEAATETWLKGVRDNLAAKPAGGDREQVRDVQAGKCDLAIGNTYYMAAMLKNPAQKPWADAVKMLFPNSGDRGSHVNISGVAVTRNAPHRDNALKLVSFLASDEAQKIYAETNNEYPVSPNVQASELVRSWGTLKPDALPLENISKYRAKASELIDKVGFDGGPQG